MAGRVYGPGEAEEGEEIESFRAGDRLHVEGAPPWSRVRRGSEKCKASCRVSAHWSVSGRRTMLPLPSWVPVTWKWLSGVWVRQARHDPSV